MIDCARVYGLSEPAALAIAATNEPSAELPAQVREYPNGFDLNPQAIPERSSLKERTISYRPEASVADPSRLERPFA